jgi:hypothetical protein
MTALSALWLPILLSSVLVFVVSSIIHMAPLWHKSDYPKLPNEDRVMDALRPLGLPPGDYYMPRPAGAAEMRAPEFIEKVKRGPNVLMTVMPPMEGRMAKSLTLWFVYIVVVGVFAASIASRALAPGAAYFEVFRFVGTSAFIGYALALWQMSIWYHRAVSMSIKATVDGLIYASLTAGVFGWLWPR